MAQFPLQGVKPNEETRLGDTLLGGAETYAVKDPDPILEIPVASHGITDSVKAGFSDQLQAQQVSKITRERASLYDTLSASVNNMDTTRSIKWLLNKFDDADLEPTAKDPDFNLEERMVYNPTPLSTDEREWIRDKAPKSEGQYQQYMDYIKTQREFAQVLGDRPLTAMAVSALDPMYYLVGSAAFGTARMLNTTRKTAAALGATYESSALALVEETRPVDSVEYVAAALIGGLATGVFHTPIPRDQYISPFTVDGIMNMSPIGKHRVQAQINKAVAEDFNDFNRGLRQTEETLQGIANTNVDLIKLPQFKAVELSNGWSYSPTRNTIYDTIRGAHDVPAIRMETLNVGNVVRNFKPEIPTNNSAGKFLNDIANNLALPEFMRTTAKQIAQWGGSQLDKIAVEFGKRMRKSWAGYYTPSTHNIKIAGSKSKFQKGDPQVNSTTIHETVHGLTALKYMYGKANPDTTHGKLVKEIDDLFAATHRAAKKQDLDLQSPYVKYGFENPHEFMARLLQGKPEFMQYLSKLDLPKSVLKGIQAPTLEGEMYDSIRRLLGLDLSEANALTRALQLTEDLIRTPAKYVMELTPDGKAIPMKLADDITPAQVVNLTEQEIAQQVKQNGGLGRKVGNTLAWNLYKTMAKIDPKTASMWVSDPLRTNAGRNIVSSRRAIRSELGDMELKYQTALRQGILDSGIKWWEFILKPAKVRAVQDEFHREIQRILVKWENESSKGITRSGGEGAAYRAAEAFNAVMQRAGREGEAAGLFTRGLTTSDGYFPRKFNATRINELDDIVAQFFNGDLSKARGYMAKQLAANFRGMEKLDTAEKDLIARAMLDRARRQGELQDLTFRGHMGLEVVIEVEDLMRRQGASYKDIERVKQVLEGKVKEAGQANYQKSRIDLNMDGLITMPDGSTVRVSDMIDHNMTTLLGNYLDDISGRLAMAEFGIKNTADIDKARQAFVAKAKGDKARREAQDLFENVVKDILGQPVGEEMADMLRYTQMFTTSISLRNSGLWQVTEFAKMMQRYAGLVGFGQTMKQIFGSFTGMAKVLESPEHARSLQGILSRNSYNELRLRPYIDKLDDGFMAGNSSVMTGAKHATQWVYVANGMSYIQRRQSIAAANLITDTLELASKGDVKARDFFKKFGFDDTLLDDVAKEFNRHGSSVDKWSEGVWDRVRSPLQTVMDEDVLRSRTGEIPAIAQFSSVGKTIFTFRNFTLSSHNKILANGLANDGLKAMSMFFAYQLALSAVMVQAANVSREGTIIKDYGEWANKAVSMMGGLGLLVEGIGAITGENKQFGSPFLIAIDRLYRLGNQIGDVDPRGAATTVADSIPLVSLLPAWGVAVRTLFGD